VEIKDSPFRGILVTKGRVSGREHQVILRGVKYDDKIYFSRHRPDSDWFQNAMANSTVRVIYDKSTFVGSAKIVRDDVLNQKISQLKYPDEKRAEEKRVSIEITLHEQQ